MLFGDVAHEPFPPRGAVRTGNSVATRPEATSRRRRRYKDHLRAIECGNRAGHRVPRIFAHQNGCASPRCFEGADIGAAFHKPFFVEESVRRQIILAMHMTQNRRTVIEPDGDVGRAVVQRLAPPLVEANDDIDRHTAHAGRGAGHPVGVVQIVRERTGRAGDFAHGPFNEIPRERSLREVHNLRARIERRSLRAQRTDTGQVGRRVTLFGGELADGKRQGADRITGHIEGWG